MEDGAEPLDETAAEVIWRKAVEQLLEAKNAKCQHEKSGETCQIKTGTSKCTFRWWVTDCILISGEMSKVARELEYRLGVQTMMGKVKWTENGLPVEVAGLLVSYENCRTSMEAVYEFVEYIQY